nr:hypothetical protein [Sedimentibacter sp.]
MDIDIKDQEIVQEVKVVEFKPGVAMTAPTICFTFTVLCFLFWANLMGFLGEGASFAIGAVQLGVYGVYLAGAILLCKNGINFDGNVFMIFASFFGGVGATTNIMGAIASFVGMPFSDNVMGVVNIMCGIFLLGILPAQRHEAWTSFGVFFFAGVSLLILGLSTVGAFGTSALALKIVAWGLFCDGLCGIWLALNIMNGFSGLKMHLGGSLVKKKQ